MTEATISGEDQQMHGSSPIATTWLQHKYRSTFPLVYLRNICQRGKKEEHSPLARPVADIREQPLHVPQISLPFWDKLYVTSAGSATPMPNLSTRTSFRQTG